MSEQNNITVLDTEQSQIPSTADMLFADGMMDKIERFAMLMAKGKSTIPSHLSGSPADCMAVCMQAAQWKMNPFAVAQKTHLVSGTLGYEAQLVNAVINSMAPTKDRIHFEWFGDWSNVIGNFIEKNGRNNSKYLAPNWSLADEKGCGVKVWATLKGEEEPRVLELLLSQATVRNSTLWASDPKQQLAYLGVKRWSRLYCPDVIMGVYTPDELQEIPPEKVINPGASLDELVAEANPDEASAKIKEIEGLIDNAKTIGQLNAVGAKITMMAPAVQNAVRPAYDVKIKALKQAQQAQTQATTEEKPSIEGEASEVVPEEQLESIIDSADSLETLDQVMAWSRNLPDDEAKARIQEKVMIRTAEFTEGG